MNVWKSIFVAELFRMRLVFAGYFVFLAGSCVLKFQQLALLEKGHLESDSINFVEGLLVFASACYMPVYVFLSAWRDSPARGNSHLIFRPVRYRTVATAKLTAWLLLFVLPSMIAEALLVGRMGFSAGTILTGAAQTAVSETMGVLMVFALAWMWGSFPNVVMCIAVIIATLWGMAAMAEKKLGLPVPDTHDSTLPVLLPMVANILIGIAVVAFHSVRRRHEWLRMAAVPVLLYAGTCAGLLAAGPLGNAAGSSTRTSHRSKLPMREIPTALAAASLGHDVTNPGVAELEVLPSIPLLPPDQEVAWNITGTGVPYNAAADTWAFPTGRKDGDTSFTLAAYNALSRHVGGGLRMQEKIAARRWTSTTKEVLTGKNFHDVSSNLEGFITRWSVVKDRPLLPLEEEGRVFVSRDYSFFWTGGGDHMEIESRKDLYFLYSPQDGSVEPLVTNGYIDFEGAMLGWQAPVNFRYTGKRPFRGCRLIVLRPQLSGVVKTSWSPATTLPPVMRKYFSDHLRADDKAFHKDFLDWFSKNPAPAATASSEEMAKWLGELLPRLSSGFPETPGLREAISAVTASHPAELLDSLNAMGADGLDARAAVSNFLPDSLLRRSMLPHLPRAGDPDVPQPGDTRMVELLAPYAAMKARRGESRDVEEILFSAPEAVGLKPAEWLDLYRLSPSARSYNALRKAGIPEEDLKRETDMLLEHLLPLARDSGDWSGPSLGAVPDVELALASGHPQAPAWFAACLRTMDASGHIHLPSLSAEPTKAYLPYQLQQPAAVAILRYFAVPEDIATKGAELVVQWFRGKEPEEFVFDPVTRKFGK